MSNYAFGVAFYALKTCSKLISRAKCENGFPKYLKMLYTSKEIDVRLETVFFQNLCSSLGFSICFECEFQEIPTQKSSKTVRGVAKAEGPAAEVAKPGKWTMF